MSWPVSLRLEARRFRHLFRRSPSSALSALLKRRFRRIRVLFFGVVFAVSLTITFGVQYMYFRGLGMSVPVANAAVLVALAATATGVVAATILPTRLWVRTLLPRFGVYSSIAFVVSIPYFYWYANAEPVDPAYFSTVSQILPVLVLVTLVDVRQSAQFSHNQTTIYVVCISIGELICLDDVAFNRPGSISFAVSSAAVLAAFVGLTISLLAKNAGDSAR